MLQLILFIPKLFRVSLELVTRDAAPSLARTDKGFRFTFGLFTGYLQVEYGPGA